MSGQTGRSGAALGGAIIGGIIGTFAGGNTMLGAQLGFALGSAVGAAFIPVGDAGKPAKADLSVQEASYGSPIAVLAGADRIAGTLIWVKDNEIQAEKVKTGGKGMGMSGAGGAPTYEYFGNFAVLIGKGPIDGVRKIWADTKLIYDKSGTALDEALYTGDGHVAHLSGIDGHQRVYLGTDDQLPDPAIQADRGAASTPAFRSLAYIVFDELPLANFANRIPNISVEYVKDGEFTHLNIDLTGVFPNGYGADSTDQFSNLDPYGPYLYNSTATGYIARYNLVTRECEIQRDVNSDTVTIGGYAPVVDEFGNLYVPAALATGKAIYRFDAITLAHTGTAEKLSGSANPPYYLTYRSYRSGSTRYLVGIDVLGGLHVYDPATLTQLAPLLSVGSGFQSMVDITEDGVIYVPWNNGIGTSRVYPVTLSETPLAANQYAMVAGTPIDVSAQHSGFVQHVCWYEDEQVLLLAGNGVLSKVTPAGAVLGSLSNVMNVASFMGFRRGPVNGRLWGKRNGAGGAFVEIDIASMTVLREVLPTEWTAAGGTKLSAVYDPWSDALIAVVDGNQGLRQLYLPRIDPLDVDRADVITQYSEEVNLTASQIDVTLVTDTIQGNTVRKPVIGRDALEPILHSGFIDPVNVDRKVKFVPRGQAVTLTVSEDDLGATLDERASDRQKLIELIDQEIRLPQQITLRHVNRAAQYDIGAQTAKRSTSAVNTREKITVDTSEVMSDDTARQLVDKLLYSSWQERTRLRFSLMPKHGKLIPTDVINITRGNVSYEVRLDRVDIGPFLECEGVPQDTATYVSSATGAPSSIPTEVLQVLSPTTLFLIDANMLRDEDDDGEHYLAIAPTINDGLWPGAQIFKSSDAVSYQSSTSFTTAVDWGIAEDALSDHHCTTTDRANTLTIQMVRDVAGLASVTELAMLNGANAFLLESDDDWELIQAASITSLGDGRYTLATLLRGVRGTEQVAGDHAAGDRIIVLDADTMQRLGQASEIGLTRYYKATTIGAIFNPTGAISFANTARGRECYAPAHVKGSRDGSANITVTWLRRSRIGGELDWGDAIADVPLGEDSEEYKVEIMQGSTVKRTIEDLTSETTTYTAAQQVTDFGSTQSSVSVRVYQVSEDNGPGRVATAVV